jgi:hypothetical protein
VHVRALSERVRGKLANKLERAIRNGTLAVEQEQGLRAIRRAVRKRWVVYAKPPFAGPKVFLRYISRYVHRVAIDDRRITAYDGRRVTFTYRDRRRGDAIRSMTLTATAFLRRFLLHTLPSGFVKIRNCGLLANSVKKKNLARCRALLGPAELEDTVAGEAEDLDTHERGADDRRCPHCDVPLEHRRELPPESTQPSTTRPP